MTFDDEQKQEAHVRDIFTRIAGRYDLMNRIMSGGRDIHWRKRMLRKVDLHSTDRVLDLGAGTGDLSCEVRKQHPGIDITAGDFTLGMMLTGRNWQSIKRCNADALRLPFPAAAFDKVISGFLVRNVEDVDLALREQARVLKPGGRIAILDMTRPRPNVLTPFINLFLNRIVPFIGTLITGQKDAYTYLPSSTQHFLRAEELAEKMKNAGFLNVEFEILNFGTVAIHHGVKPPKA